MMARPRLSYLCSRSSEIAQLSLAPTYSESGTAAQATMLIVTDAESGSLGLSGQAVTRTGGKPASRR